MKRSLAVVALLAGTVRAQPDPDIDARLPPVERDVVPGKVTVTLPPQPAFDVPPTATDGTRSVRELRLRGKRLLDTEVVVTGVITWVYDCVIANTNQGESVAEVKKRIEVDPTLCERPKFYLGDKGGSPDKNVWVVDVPRPYNKLELARIKKADRTDPTKCEPGDKKSICPVYKVGDEVVLRGTFALQSTHGERNSDGLIIYGRMRNKTQNWETPLPAPPPIATTSTAPRPWTAPPLDKVGKPVWLRVKKSVYDSSVKLGGEGDRALANRQFDTAIERFGKSIDAWRANHHSFYGLALAYAHKGEWAKAVDAVGIAVQLDPTIAMYRLLYGRAIYEKLIFDAREDAARKNNRRPEQVTPDYAAINFERAFLQLSYAVALDNALWRAHYLLGKIHQFGDRAKEAAAELNKAVSFGPPEAAPWIALAELYRTWDFTDQAIAVATQATTIASPASETARVWFALGAAYDDKQALDQAIEAYTKALDIDGGELNARFMRGQAFYKKGDLVKAKRDLETFAKTAGPNLEFFKQSAARMLMDIAAKNAR